MIPIADRPKLVDGRTITKELENNAQGILRLCS